MCLLFLGAWNWALPACIVRSNWLIRHLEFAVYTSLWGLWVFWIPLSWHLRQKNGSLMKMSMKTAARHPHVVFLIHVDGIQHNEFEFTALSNVNGSANEKLGHLLNIREKRLNEPHDSPYRMEDVCSKIPDTLTDVNLEEVGYHRGCYQNFTRNLDRLKGAR